LANEETNLIPHQKQFTSGERARKMGSKGGKVKSEKKLWAARLRELKKKGLSDENYKQLVAMMTEKKSFALDVLMFLQGTKKDCDSAGQKTNVARALTDLMKATHGEEIKTENVHHIVNWNEMFERCEKDDDE
jgi:hypothetical protein